MTVTPTTNDTPAATSRIISDMACMRCGCLCDDLELTISGQRIAAVSPGCLLAESWFARQRGDVVGTALVGGKSVEYTTAIAEAARLLMTASSPLVLGMGECLTDGQRAVLALADLLGASLDVPVPAAQAASIAAFQVHGASTCTLGEVRERADLVIYWKCDPDKTHPRLRERFIDASGRKLKGRADRKVVVIHTRGTPAPGAETADQVIHVEPGGDMDVITVLRRMLVMDEKDLSLVSDETAGVTADELIRLSVQMRSCHYGAVFFGDAMVASSDSHDVANGRATVASLHRLTSELNAQARFVIRYLSGPGNLVGAGNVMAWQTGYPASVDFSAGYPQYLPDECCGSVLLERGEIDAVLILGDNAFSSLSALAREKVQQLPVVSIHHDGNTLPFQSDVELTTATPGVHSSGTAYRMDDVPIRIRKIFESSLLSDKDIIQAIRETIATSRSLHSNPESNHAEEQS